MRNKAKDGNYFWVSTTIVPFLDKEHKPFQYIVIRNDITKSKENEMKLEHLSNVDGLTSLFNRRYFDRMLDYYWKNLSGGGHSLSIILFDVDYFKYDNDYYGHVLGDKCLIDCSNRIKELLSSYEAVCARYGGEEFATIIPQRNSHEVYYIAEKIRLEIEKLNIPHKMSRINEWVTMSFGVATVIPNQIVGPKLLLEQADRALYQAKHNGRNTVIQFEETHLLREIK